ncbi:rhodanese-like domain-containing protein [Endozoicomonadaceae bacterium StTr2]
MKWSSHTFGCCLMFVVSLLQTVPSAATEAPTSINGVITVNVHQARYLYEAGAVFLDVRPQEQWEWGHVEGAHSLDLGSAFSQLSYRDDIDRETPMVIYGNSSYHMQGAFASYLASLWGYKRIFYLREGYFSWLSKDFPVDLTAERDPACLAQAELPTSDAKTC